MADAPHEKSIRPPPGFVRRIGLVVDRGIMAFFGAIADFVADRPIKVIAGAILLALLLGAGILRIHVVTDGEKLYTPQNNQAFKDQRYVEKLYGYEQNYLWVYITPSKGSDSNVLTKPILLSLLDLVNKLRSVNGSVDGRQYNLEDPRVCFRPGGLGTPCKFLSVLDFWNYSRSAIEADNNIFATVSDTNATDALGQVISAGAVMGSITYGTDGRISGAKALKVTVYLQNNKEGSGSSKVDDVVQSWEKAAVPTLKAVRSDVANFYVLSTWYENDVSDKAITADISLLFLGYFLLVAYGLLVLSKAHPVESRSYMGILNVLSVALAVLGSYGFCMLIGIDFNLVSQVLALLLLGLGTDDMLVTMAAHEETGKEMPNCSLKERIVATVSRARRGVIVASTTNLIAFLTGISSELPALRDFMIYAAVGVVLVLIFQSTFYVACLVLDLKRQRANLLDTLCCITSSAGPSDGCCGRPYDPNQPRIGQLIIGKWLPSVILNPAGKVVVLAISGFLLVGGAIGASKVRQNFDIDWFIPSGNYIRKVYDVRNNYFTTTGGKGIIPVGAYTKNPATPPLDYFNYQDELTALTVNLQANKWVSSAPVVESWYSEYIKWLPVSSHASQLTPSGRPKTSEDFYNWLNEFISSTGARFKGDIIFAPNSTSVILSTRINIFTVNLPDSPAQVNAMRSLRTTTETSAPSLDAIAYNFPFLFFEGFAVISKDTILAVSLAACAVFVVMLLLLADILTSVLVGIMVVMIDIELVGFLYWAGLSFNSVSSINLLLAIGIAVDYSAFTAYAFLTQLGTRQERVRKALSTLGVAVFNGGFTIFLTVLPLVLAKSFIFQTFFKMFSMIVILGLWHGLCLLPVILTFIGPQAYESAFENQEKLDAQAAADQKVAHGEKDEEAKPSTPPHVPPPQVMAAS